MSKNTARLILAATTRRVTAYHFVEVGISVLFYHLYIRVYSIGRNMWANWEWKVVSYFGLV